MSTAPKTKSHSPFARPLLTLFSAGTAVGLSDGELLHRFTSGGDDSAEMAFSVLVERHGAMVLRVCRGVTGDRTEAEDAFQSTFLILARKARTVRVGETLAPWLYGVARKVSARAVASTQRRRRFIERFAEWTTRGSTTRADTDDSAALIREELARLPHRYQAAVRLCDLDGFSQEEAAELLRLPLGTIKSRLFRGRAKLREALVRRGFSTAWVWSVPQGVSTFTLPPQLASLAVRAALAENQGTIAAGALISSTVIALTEGSMQAMFMTKVKVAVCLAIGAGVVAGGSWARNGTGTDAAFGAFPQEPATVVAGSEAPKASTTAARQEVSDSKPPEVEKPTNVEAFSRFLLEFYESKARALTSVRMKIAALKAKHQSSLEEGRSDEEVRKSIDELEKESDKLDAQLRAIVALSSDGTPSLSGALPVQQPNDSPSPKLEMGSTLAPPAVVEPTPAPPRYVPPVLSTTAQEIESAKGEVALALSDFKRAVDRLNWSNTMFRKGYVAKGQNKSDSLDLDRAILALTQSVSKLKLGDAASTKPEASPPSQVVPTADKETANSDLNHQIAVAKTKLAAKKGALNRAKAQESLAVAVVAINDRLNKRVEGSVSNEEREKAAAEQNVAKAGVEIAEAEFQESELELKKLEDLLASRTPPTSLPEPSKPDTTAIIGELKHQLSINETHRLAKKGSLRRAQAQADEAKAVSTRYEKLQANNAISAEEVQKAKSGLEVALAGVDIAEAELKERQLEVDLIESMIKKAVEGKPVTTPSSLDQGESQRRVEQRINVLEAKLDQVLELLKATSERVLSKQ